MSGDKEIRAEIICDSISPAGGRMTTFVVRFPRIILAEVNTHKMISKNSASSRARPSAAVLEEARTHPFLPSFWGKNQKGMQAAEEIADSAKEAAQHTWETLVRQAVHGASQLADAGVHKQLANRPLEPYMYHTAVLSGTEWSNFFALRAHPDAQPEFQELAFAMRTAYAANTPSVLVSGAWHLPFVDEREQKVFRDEILCRMSVARCARVSYLTQDGRKSYEDDLALYERLVTSGHMSPLEHVARALSPDEWGRVVEVAAGWWLRKRVPMGNLWGFLQFRKTVPNEHDFGLVVASSKEEEEK